MIETASLRSVLSVARDEIVHMADLDAATVRELLRWPGVPIYGIPPDDYVLVGDVEMLLAGLEHG